MSDPLATIPLSAIRVFEAAARLSSFTRAAEELGITQAAVSWQVKALERRLDQALFRRLPREVALTPAGERLARAASEAMASLRGALTDLTETGQGVLSITTMQTLAMYWLAPRLGGFQLAQPAIAVRVDTTERVVDLLRDEADVALRHGRGVWPGMEAVPLFSSAMTVLAPPEAAAKLGEAPDPAMLLDLPRIGVDDEWSVWFAAAGVETRGGKGEMRITADSQVLEVAAAVANGGFALASPVLFGAEIRSGRLVQPFDIEMPYGGGYWLVYPQDRRRTRKIAAFRDWILAEIAADPSTRPIS
jgi:LysR family transcriptional regulator, glycine cleavage system transcriptional activator